MRITFRSPIRIRLTAKGRAATASFLVGLATALTLVCLCASAAGAILTATFSGVTAVAAGVYAVRLGTPRKTAVRWSRATGKTTTRRTYR